MPPKLLRLERLTPKSIRVIWQKPEKLNGESVWYEVCRRGSNDKLHGEKWFDRRDGNETEFHLTLNDLLPSSNYSVWVRAFSKKGDALSESEKKSIVTLANPSNLALEKITPHNITVSWVAPNDSSILR